MPRSSYLAVVLVGAIAVLGVAWLSTSSRRRGLQANPRGPSLVAVDAHSAADVEHPASPDESIRTDIGPSVIELRDQRGDSGTDRLLRAQSELATQITNSLDGFLYINYLLDQVQEFANLPVDPRVDLDYDDEDAVAFKILGTPKGTCGRFLVGRKSFERNGKELKFLQMEIAMGVDESPVFFRDSLRRGPRLHMTVDYDSNGTPNAMALILQRDIDLKESRKQDMNAFVGTYTTGAGYRVNLVDQESCFSETFGLVNGRISHRQEFNGISPLAGDTQIDKEKLQALFEALMRSRLAVRGSLSESK